MVGAVLRAHHGQPPVQQGDWDPACPEDQPLSSYAPMGTTQSVSSGYAAGNAFYANGGGPSALHGNLTNPLITNQHNNSTQRPPQNPLVQNNYLQAHAGASPAGQSTGVPSESSCGAKDSGYGTAGVTPLADQQGRFGGRGDQGGDPSGGHLAMGSAAADLRFMSGGGDDDGYIYPGQLDRYPSGSGGGWGHDYGLQ